MHESNDVVFASESAVELAEVVIALVGSLFAPTSVFWDRRFCKNAVLTKIVQLEPYASGGYGFSHMHLILVWIIFEARELPETS